MSTYLPVKDDPLNGAAFIKKCLDYTPGSRPLFGDLAKELTAKENELKAHPENDTWGSFEPSAPVTVVDTEYGETKEYDRQDKEE